MADFQIDDNLAHCAIGLVIDISLTLFIEIGVVTGESAQKALDRRPSLFIEGVVVENPDHSVSNAFIVFSAAFGLFRAHWRILDLVDDFRGRRGHICDPAD